MSFTPGSGAVIAVGVDGAAASKRDIDSVGDALRRLNESNFQKLSGQVGSIQGHFTSLKASIGDFFKVAAAGAGIAAFAGIVKGALDTAAGLHDLSIQTGASVAALMQFRDIGATSDTTVQSIGGAMNKLAKGMAVASEESKGIGQAFKAIGIDFTTFKDLAPDVQMLTVARSLDQFQDGAGKSAVAMTLFGKEGAKMLPFLQDLAAESDNVTKSLTAQEISSKAALAAMADDYGDNLTKISKASEESKKAISFGMLPALFEASDAFLKVSTEAGGLKETIAKLSSDGTIAEWTRGGITGITYLADGFQILGRIVTSVGKVIGGSLALTMTAFSGLANAMILFVRGEYKQSWDLMQSTSTQAGAIIKAAAGDISDVFSEATFGAKIRARMEEIKGAGAAAQEVKKHLKFDANGDAASVAAMLKAAEEYAKLLDRIRGKDNGQDADFQKNIAILYKGYEAGKQSLSEYTATVEAYIKQQKSSIDIEAERQKSIENVAKALQELEDDRASAYAGAIKEADSNEELVRTFGMTKSAIEALGLARMEDRLAQQLSLDLDEKEVAQLERLIAAKKRSVSAAATIEGLEAQRDVWKSIDQTAHDTFVSIFDSGKSAFDRLRDTLKSGLLDLLYQMTVKKWIFNIGASVTGNASGIAGAGSALSNVANAGSVGNSLLSIGGNIGSTVTGIGALMGSSTVGAFGTGLSAGFAGTGVAEAAAAYSAAGMSGVAGGLSSGAAIGGVVSDGVAMLAAIPGWGWAVLGAAAIGAYLMNDGPESNTRLGFTSNNAAGNISINERGNEGKNSSYIDPGVSSAFGTFGVSSSFWMSSSSPTVKNFLATVAQTDDALATFLTATEKASVSSFLTGKVSTAHSGPEGSDPNANGELDGVFRERIANIFNGIEPGLAALVTGFTGTSQALATEAGALLQYRSALQDSGEAVFGAKVTMQQLAALKAPTEATSAALIRITAEFNTTNQVLDLLGKSSAEAFGATGLASESARAQLILLSGGVAAMGAQAASFAQNYFSDAERLAPMSKALDATLAGLGLETIPTTREEFRDLVDDLVSTGQLATETGAKQYAGLMSVNEAFAQVHPLIEETTAALRSQADVLSERKDLQKQLDNLTMSSSQLLAKQRDALDASNRSLFDQVQAATAAKAAQDRAKSSLSDVISNMASFGDTARALSDGLLTGSLSTLTPMQQYEETRRQFEKTRMAALGGDSKAQGSYSEMLTSFLSASQKINGGDAQYSADFNIAQHDSDTMANWADGQVSVAQASLNALNDQVDGITNLNATMLSVARDISNLSAALVSIPMPVPMFPTQPDYSRMGTPDMAPLVDKIKELVEEVRTLRAEQHQQTGDMMARDEKVAMNAAAVVVEATLEAARVRTWRVKPDGRGAIEP